MASEISSDEKDDILGSQGIPPYSLVHGLRKSKMNTNKYNVNVRL